MSLTSKFFGKCNDISVTEYILENKNGMSVSVLDRGATIRSIAVPDKNGVKTDVALALCNPEDYEENEGYMGSAIGRVANRLKKGEFCINKVLRN